MFKITDLEWDIEEFKNLTYTPLFHKDEVLVNLYTGSGHDYNRMCVWTYWEPNIMPDVVYKIRDKFNYLNNLVVAVHKTNPGYYLPIHFDLYEKYQSIYNIKNKDIHRSIVMLEDSELGQLFQIESVCYAEWDAGTVYSWKNDAKHAIYNFSTVDRYAIQITGWSDND